MTKWPEHSLRDFATLTKPVTMKNGLFTEMEMRLAPLSPVSAFTAHSHMLRHKIVRHKRNGNSHIAQEK